MPSASVRRWEERRRRAIEDCESRKRYAANFGEVPNLPRQTVPNSKAWGTPPHPGSKAAMKRLLAVAPRDEWSDAAYWMREMVRKEQEDAAELREWNAAMHGDMQHYLPADPFDGHSPWPEDDGA